MQNEEQPKEKVADMVNKAIKCLKNRKGSSLYAIKKYLVSNYQSIDLKRLTPFIRRYLRRAVANGILLQKKGKGARGSFKLPYPIRKKRLGKACKTCKTCNGRKRRRPNKPKDAKSLKITIKKSKAKHDVKRKEKVPKKK